MQIEPLDAVAATGRFPKRADPGEIDVPVAENRNQCRAAEEPCATPDSKAGAASG
jgi:hypothetical protein